jgi:hypothetical protein
MRHAACDLDEPALTDVNSFQPYRAPARFGDRIWLRAGLEACHHQLASLELGNASGSRRIPRQRVSRQSQGPAFLKLKPVPWNDFARHLTESERETALDC